jgi:hypothetical protein
MSGKVVHYKFCELGFDRYCQIHEEDQLRNGMVARMQGAILLGPSGNAQGNTLRISFCSCLHVINLLDTASKSSFAKSGLGKKVIYFT